MPIQLVITLGDDGQVGVNAPIQDRILCYGLLECARAAIDRHCAQPKPDRNGILLPPPGTVVPKSHQ